MLIYYVGLRVEVQHMHSERTTATRIHRPCTPQSVQADQVSLYVSDDLARSFQEICMPTPLEDRGYNLVRTHDAKSAFLIVDHDEQDSWEVRKCSRMGRWMVGWVHARKSSNEFIDR